MILLIKKFWDEISDSFWFIPLVMAVIACALAITCVWADHTYSETAVKEIGWLWSGGTDGARSLLSVVAGSAMTVVSIVFSLTITSLAQTSSHYGPRVLRNFTSDRIVQFTLGTFVSTFVYCLLVLRTVRSVEQSKFIPHISVSVGLLLALMSLAVLIMFIHHISQCIQAENLIAQVAANFESSLSLFFPDPADQQKNSQMLSPADQCESWSDAHAVNATATGYIQRIDKEALMELAINNNLVIKAHRGPGSFVAAGTLLAGVSSNATIEKSISSRINGCFSIGRNRTAAQDSLYTIQQLVEIAVHALSPGINEPFTAITCIDWLGASLLAISQRQMPTSLSYDQQKKLRLITPAVDFDLIAHAAFDQIRLYGAANPDVSIRLLHVMTEAAPFLRRVVDTHVLTRHAELIGIDASKIENGDDRQRVESFMRKTLDALSKQGLTLSLVAGADARKTAD